MGGSLTLTELADFADWLDGEQTDRAPYMAYLDRPEYKVLCCYVYNPFDMEKKARMAFQGMQPIEALLVDVSGDDGFSAKVTGRRVCLHDGRIYKKRELWPLHGGFKYKIGGYCPENTYPNGGERDNLLKGVALLTASVYQRAAEDYPGPVFFTSNSWPAAIRIR